MITRVLVIDDEETIRLSLKEGLSDMGYTARVAADGKSGLEMVAGYRPQVIFLDMRLPDLNGLDMIEPIREMDADIQVVMMTAYGDIRTAVAAIKSGAFDYLHKPFDLDEVQVILDRIRDHVSLRKKLYLLENEAITTKREPMIGKHPSFQEVFEKIAILAENDSVTVLIRGETGTGKELVAVAIHEKSGRHEAPMVSINCAAISPSLIESELFGHEKNAFTGAGTLKKGLLEIADGGTVFLDEIGELSTDTQTKLLRVLEERKFKRVGGLEDIEVDIRIMAATNKNLEEAIERREFREDLYYRLNVVPLNLPPLRERGEDVLLIARHFLQKDNLKFRKAITGFTPEAERKMLAYSWRGNVRELKNVIERMVILHQGTQIDVRDLPQELQQGKEPRSDREGKRAESIDDIPEPFNLEDHLQQIEAVYLRKALEKCGNNHTKAAEILGISRFALKRKMEKQDINP